MTPESIETLIDELTMRMNQAAEKLEFEEAARIRDEIRTLEKKEMELSAF